MLSANFAFEFRPNVGGNIVRFCHRRFIVQNLFLKTVHVNSCCIALARAWIEKWVLFIVLTFEAYSAFSVFDTCLVKFGHWTSSFKLLLADILFIFVGILAIIIPHNKFGLAKSYNIVDL